MRGENRPEDEEQQVWKTPLVDFHDFLGMARALQVEELSELHARFQLADQDQDGAVVEGEFLSLLPEDAALLVCGKVHTLLLDAQIQAGQLMSFDDVFDVLSLCRTTSNFTKFEVEELNQAFTRFDEDNSGKIDVLEMVEMLLYMGFNSSLEHAWADMVDSSQEPESQEVAPPLLHQDSYQDSQASQVCTQGGLCDLLQSTTALDAAPASSGAASSGAGITRRKHLEEISDEERWTTSPRGRSEWYPKLLPLQRNDRGPFPWRTWRKRAAQQLRCWILQALNNQLSLLWKRKRQQRSLALDHVLPVAEAEAAGDAGQDGDDDGNPGNPGNAEEAALAARMQKRYNLIAVHKDRDDYKAFNQRYPRHLREIDQPMTPDPRDYGSKRAWESAAQRWREDLRSWYAGWGIIIQSDVDGNSELDFSEFLHVMATHELTHTKAVRNAFRKMTSRSKICTQDQMSFLLQSLGYFPGETVFEEMLAEDGLNDVQAGEGRSVRSFRRTDPMESRRIFWICTLILECCFVAHLLLWLLLRCRRFSTGPKSPEPQPSSLAQVASRIRQLQGWLWQWSKKDSSSIEVDRSRCQMTQLLWNVVLYMSLVRLMIQQILIATGRAPIRPEFDLQVIFLGAVGLLISCKPGLITPRSLDFVYVSTTLLSIVCLIPSPVDATMYVAFSFKAEIIFSALTKRLWVVFFCHIANFVFTVHLSRPDTSWEWNGGFFMLFWLTFIGIFCLRSIFLYCATLKLDLKKRAVELGVVSSMLLVCYDAVVEVDEDLNLIEHSQQLSSMLLHAQMPINSMAGKSFLECFDVQDQDRLSKQFNGPTGTNGSTVIALNADMLDADQNRVKVELLIAPFETLSNEKHFLIGIRELQGLDALAPLATDRTAASPQWEEVSLPTSAAVVFEVPSFEILIMSEEIQQLCHELGSYPQNILDLASDQSRYSLCDQLQDLANRASEASTDGREDSKVTFTLGHTPISAWVAFEFDEMLDTFVGCLEVCPEGNKSLTEANLQKLNELQTTLRGSSKASSRPSIRSARSASVRLDPQRATAQRPAKRSVGSVARSGPGRVKASIRL
eukprot:symbB.v1.2.021069.t1/scaffold1801.1/size100802/2